MTNNSSPTSNIDHASLEADRNNSVTISFHDVTFAYDGVPALKNVNLSIYDRDFVCVIGPNGGGKTTLLKLILGLIEPQRGTVNVLGQTPEQACRRIGYMPQQAHLDPQFPVNVMDVVLMGCLNNDIGPYRSSDRQAALQALEAVNLVDLKTRPFSTLSGGQRQRVLIARALACQPELLLLDEPTANLDPAVQDSLYELMHSLNEQFTIIIVSHDVGFVSVFFKSVICVNQSAHMHSTKNLTEQQVADMYGRTVRLLHHGGPSS